jgi:HPt (histidine-containing phosphotransfer) domain-containing protein
MIDRQKFNEIFQYFDKEVILNIIDLFEKELPVRLEKIQKNILEKDFEALAFNAHSMKSVAGTFMVSAPAELAGRMEELARQGTVQGLQEVYEELKASAEDLLGELIGIRREFAS